MFWVESYIAPPPLHPPASVCFHADSNFSFTQSGIWTRLIFCWETETGPEQLEKKTVLTRKEPRTNSTIGTLDARRGGYQPLSNPEVNNNSSSFLLFVDSVFI